MPRGAIQHRIDPGRVRDVGLAIVGHTHRAADLKSLSGTQPGGPANAARAIELALAAPKTPLRLQLGGFGGRRAHAETLLDLASWQRVSRDTKLDQLAQR
jgi:hypothetical protein